MQPKHGDLLGDVETLFVEKDFQVLADNWQLATEMKLFKLLLCCVIDW